MQSLLHKNPFMFLFNLLLFFIISKTMIELYF